MNINEVIRRSGRSRINLIAPYRRYCEETEKSLKTRSRLLEVSLSTEPVAGALNILCHSSEYEEAVVAYALYNRVLGREQASPGQLHEIYRTLTASASNVLSILQLSNDNTVSRYRAKQYADLMASAGLFLSVPVVEVDTLKPTGRSLYLPFFYHGSNERVLAMRYLSSLGFDLMIGRCGEEKIDILARAGELQLAVVFGGDEKIDVLNRLSSSAIKLIISSEPVPNFSGIRSLSLEEFLAGAL